MRKKKSFLTKLFTLVLLIALMLPANVIAAGKTKINVSKKTVNVGKTCTVKLLNNKKKVKWSTSNKKIKIVSKSKKQAKIRGIKKGTSYLRAKVGKKIYKCKITVKKVQTQKPAPTPVLEPTPELTLNLSSEYQKVKVNKDGSLADACETKIDSIKWGNLDITHLIAYPTTSEEVSRVISASEGVSGSWDDSSKTYTVFRLSGKSGYIDITVYYKSKSATKRLVVEKDPDYIQVIPVENFQFSRESLHIYEGESQKLSYSITPADATDKSVSFVSSDEQIAVVGEDGTVEARMPGECTITATCGGVEAKCAVEILKKEIILDKEILILQEGAASKIDYEMRLPDLSEQEVLFSSSDENIAQVKSNGMIFANSVGECIITVRSGNICSSLSVRVIDEALINDEENGISYRAWLYDKEGRYAGGVIVAVVNNNDYSINIKSNCRFYDENGNLTGDLNTGHNSNSCLEPGKKSYLHIYGPYMPPRYEVYFEVQKSMYGGHSSGIEISNFEAEEEYRRVCAEIKNNSSIYSKYTQVSCIFYKEGIPIEISYAYPHINYVGASETLNFSSSSQAEYDSFKINIEYSHT